MARLGLGTQTDGYCFTSLDDVRQPRAFRIGIARGYFDELEHFFPLALLQVELLLPAEHLGVDTDVHLADRGVGHGELSAGAKLGRSAASVIGDEGNQTRFHGFVPQQDFARDGDSGAGGAAPAARHGDRESQSGQGSRRASREYGHEYLGYLPQAFASFVGCFSQSESAHRGFPLP